MSVYQFCTHQTPKTVARSQVADRAVQGAIGDVGLPLSQYPGASPSTAPTSAELLLVHALQLVSPIGLPPVDPPDKYPVRIQSTAPAGGPAPESANFTPRPVAYLRFDGSCISHTEAM